MDTRPQTPPNPSSKSKNLGSTPSNNGVANLSSLGANFNREQTAAWLAADAKATVIVPAERMLKELVSAILVDNKHTANDVLNLLVVKFDTEIQKVLSNTNELERRKKGKRKESQRNDREHKSDQEHKPDQERPQEEQAGDAETEREKPSAERKWDVAELLSYLEDFAKASTEKESYRHCENMTNTALRWLRDLQVDGTRMHDSAIDLIVQHIDPSLLEYHHNDTIISRKPDSIFMSLETARHIHGLGSDEPWETVASKAALKAPIKKNNNNPRLDWGDALASFEYKRRSNFKGSVNLESNKELQMIDLKDFALVGDSSTAGEKRLREPDDNGGSSHSSKVRKTSSRTAPSHASSQSQNHRGITSQPAKAPDWTESVLIQAAEYGMNRLCCSFDMTHSWTFMILNTTLYINRYDHEGTISTSGFDITQHPSHYLAFLFTLQRFNRSEWGRCGLPGLDTSSLTPSSPYHQITVNEKSFTFNPYGSPLHKTLAIGGRASTVWAGQASSGNATSKYALKFYWKETSRRSEAEILTIIEAKAGDNRDILDHVTPLIASKVFGDVSTRGIRVRLGVPEVNWVTRELVLGVTILLDGQISELGPDEFWNVWWDCFKCHYHLWECGIKHRDISTGNLMYRKDPVTSVVYGVLNDFDLASIEGDESFNRQRTGTKPFLALELLRNPSTLHRYRHDVESFFWVGVWVALCFPKTESESPTRDWPHLRDATLLEKKHFFLTSRAWHTPTARHAPGWKRWEDVLGALYNYLPVHLYGHRELHSTQAWYNLVMGVYNQHLTGRPPMRLQFRFRRT